MIIVNNLINLSVYLCIVFIVDSFIIIERSLKVNCYLSTWTTEKICKENKVRAFVAGYPVNMDGSEGPRCQSIRQFVKNLQEKIDIPALLWDERMSTMAVNRMMIEADMSRQRRSELVDKLAASYILQGALDSIKRVTG